MTRFAFAVGLALLMVAPAGSEEVAGTPEGVTSLSGLWEKAMELKGRARTPVDGAASPLFEQVTIGIIARMNAGVAGVAANPVGGAIPTIGRRCLTTAPTCGRPTLVGCPPRVTLGSGCNRTTAITCGCPVTTAPTCGQVTFGCTPKPTMSGCGLTTAPTCGNRP